jgi:hypothetical protein
MIAVTAVPRRREGGEQFSPSETPPEIARKIRLT